MAVFNALPDLTRRYPPNRLVPLSKLQKQYFMRIGQGTLYAMTKAAMNQLTRNLACEWAPEVRVNAVAPWYISTELAQQVMAKLTQACSLATHALQ
jgi:NAD(P)-dependent dehydrogenase (short-subunit alcohol dehydrogenase family)